MSEHIVGIIGAGTMGAGIAQVAAVHGWTVRLLDVDEDVARAAIAGVGKRLVRLEEKGRLTAEARTAAAGRLRPATEAADLAGASIVIEAIVEDLDVKARVLKHLLAVLDSDAIIATNTSSLSVTALGAAVGAAPRVVGMHFFNPAPLLKLVEVIAGAETDPAVVDRVVAIAESWDKVVARAADVPGFIVNHVARPYYLEAFRIVEDGHAAPDEIDAAMTSLGGFRMGPLALTDLIGQDVNTATTRSVWEQLGRPPLLAPSPLQESLVAAGNLGRKTGVGVYDHGVDPATVALPFERHPRPDDAALAAAVDAFVDAAVDPAASPSPHALKDDLARYVFARILAALIVQAHLARDRGVASADDIDTALRFGVNYPRGPFAWTAAIGEERCRALVTALGRKVDRRFDAAAAFDAACAP